MSRTEASGQHDVVRFGLNEAPCRFHHAVALQDEGPVDQSEFLDRFVHERIENAAVFFGVSVKRIENELLGSLSHLFVIAQDEHGADGFSFPPGGGQVGGDCRNAFEGFGGYAVGQHFVTLSDDGLEFLVDADYEDGVKPPAVGNSTDATNAVLKAKDFPRQAEQDGCPN